MDNQNKILITGANGFLGSHLVNTLKERGDDVYAIAHKDIVLPLNLESVIKLYEPDYIYHLAAYGNMADQTDEPEIFNAILVGLFNLLQATKEIDYKGFVNVSTSSVTLPHQTLYSATKHGTEDLCKWMRDEYQKPIISFRPYTIYGEGEQSTHFIPRIFQSCMSGYPLKLSPNGSHDFVYVGDVVKDLIEVCENTDLFKTSVSCGTGISTKNSDLVEMIEIITGHKANIVGEYPARSYDVKNWSSNTIDVGKTSLLEGLTKYYEWIKK